MKDQFKVEETIEHDGKVLFTVVTWTAQGRNYLYKGEVFSDEWQENRLAECINGDYKERYGDAMSWLKAVWKRENKRCDKIQKQIDNLQEEMDLREKTIVVMEKVLP